MNERPRSRAQQWCGAGAATPGGGGCLGFLLRQHPSPGPAEPLLETHLGLTGALGHALGVAAFHLETQGKGSRERGWGRGWGGDLTGCLERGLGVAFLPVQGVGLGLGLGLG